MKPLDKMTTKELLGECSDIFPTGKRVTEWDMDEDGNLIQAPHIELERRLDEWAAMQGYCYEDKLPCDLTDELFAASFIDDGVRVYPWIAVAKALSMQAARSEPTDAELVAWGLANASKGYVFIVEQVVYHTGGEMRYYALFDMRSGAKSLRDGCKSWWATRSPLPTEARDILRRAKEESRG